MSEKTISEVWNALKNPIAVIKAEQNENEKKENNRYSAILDLQDDNGKYVLVAIEINKKTGNSVVNDIRSIHARKSYEPIIDKALNDKRLLKVDAEKIRNLLLGNTNSILESDQASSEKDLLTSQQSDLISDGAARLIERIAQQKNDVKFYQGAYHGTPHRFDEFSTEHIGTGEGAQAHGWGLYFAGNKDVSEGYRRYLAKDTFNNEKYYYNNKPIEDVTKKAILATILENSIDRVIEVREKTLYRMLHSLGDYNKEEYEKKEKELNWIKNLDVSKIEKKTDKGQLYEVDIPEDDVLLDEDKKFSEQPEFVQEKVKELFNNEIENGEKYLKDIIKHNYNGKGIYETIRERKAFEELGENLGGHYKNKYNDEFYKQASLLLNEYGIKGIKYDGRQDGECYVIFDDKAVDVIKTYYQSANNDNQNIVDLTDEFDKVPTLQEVKEYINEIVEKGTKFATLSPEWFIDIKKENSNKKQKRITNKILNNGNFLKLDKPATKRHNKYVVSLEKLLANAEYVGEKENTKPDKKPNIAMYHYFKTDVKIGDKIYQVIFDTEEYKNETSSAGNYDKSRSLNPPLEDTNSINDDKENLNPKTVHLYNISEKKKSSVLYQNANEDEPLLVGFTYQEVMNKAIEIWDKLGSEELDQETRNKLMTYDHILEDAVVEYDKKQEIFY